MYYRQLLDELLKRRPELKAKYHIENTLLKESIKNQRKTLIEKYIKLAQSSPKAKGRPKKNKSQ